VTSGRSSGCPRIGVSLGHRRKLLAAIAELAPAVPAMPQLASGEPRRRAPSGHSDVFRSCGFNRALRPHGPGGFARGRCGLSKMRGRCRVSLMPSCDSPAALWPQQGRARVRLWRRRLACAATFAFSTQVGDCGAGRTEVFASAPPRLDECRRNWGRPAPARTRELWRDGRFGLSMLRLLLARFRRL
jgi:hypothetical protein